MNFYIAYWSVGLKSKNTPKIVGRKYNFYLWVNTWQVVIIFLWSLAFILDLNTYILDNCEMTNLWDLLSLTLMESKQKLSAHWKFSKHF